MQDDTELLKVKNKKMKTAVKCI